MNHGQRGEEGKGFEVVLVRFNIDEVRYFRRLAPESSLLSFFLLFICRIGSWKISHEAFCFSVFVFFPGGSKQHRGEGQKSFVSFQSILFTIKLSRNQKRLLWRRDGGVGGCEDGGGVCEGGGGLYGSRFSVGRDSGISVIQSWMSERWTS